jgi:hypothetical protein
MGLWIGDRNSCDALILTRVFDQPPLATNVAAEKEKSGPPFEEKTETKKRKLKGKAVPELRSI